MTLLPRTTPFVRGLVRKKLLLSIRAEQLLITVVLTPLKLQFLVIKCLGLVTETLLMQLTIIMRLAYRLRQDPGYAMLRMSPRNLQKLPRPPVLVKKPALL